MPEINTNRRTLRIPAALAVLLLFTAVINANAATDTIRVMAYNVLYYGNGCQEPNEHHHSYLSTILKYANADLISLEKVSSIKLTPDDEHGVAPYGFADSILKYAFDKAYPGRYAYCTITNEAKANNSSILFYDKRKLGFANIVATYVNGTDYNTYKLYSKNDGGDTSFLYVTCNHTKSGDDFDDVRALQATGALNSIKHHFTELGNHLFLGDFNARSSEEDFYQLLVAGNDASFRFCDPPFYPDHKLTYPCNWDHDPLFATYFTTSTRETAGVPNNCGSAGGAKNWYDHIFMSRPLTEEQNDIRYIAGSYRTLGNDGQRFKVSITNANMHSNNSAPPEVINAIYRMSNKYPVMAELVIDKTKRGKKVERVCDKVIEKQEVTILEVTDKQVRILFPAELVGQELFIECKDAAGQTVISKKFILDDTYFGLRHKLAAGRYTINFRGRHNMITTTSINID